MELIWLQGAIRDLTQIRRQIAKDNPVAAERVTTRLLSGMDVLKEFPSIGRAGRVAETREFVFSDLPYIGIYRVTRDPDTVEILGVRHAARLYPPEGT